MQKSHAQWVRSLLCGASCATLLVVGAGCGSIGTSRPLLAPRAGVPDAYMGHRTHITTGPAPHRDEYVMDLQKLPPTEKQPPHRAPIGPVAKIDNSAPRQKKKHRELAPLPVPPQAPLLTYKVQRDDTLGHIAQAYGVSVGELASQNGMDKGEVLVAGRVLTIPPGGRAPRNGIVRPKPPEVKYYTVTRGDCLSKIAQKTKTTVSDLKKWNSLPNDKIREGQKLALGPGDKAKPLKTLNPTKRPIPAGGRHVVKSGQSLSTIAYSYGITVRDLKAYNGLTTDHIVPEQVLNLRAAALQPACAPRPAAPSPAPAPQVEATKKNAAAKWNPSIYTMLPHFVDRSSDTLKGVALMYGSKATWIKHANPGIATDEDLRKRREIKVPVEKSSIGQVNP